MDPNKETMRLRMVSLLDCRLGALTVARGKEEADSSAGPAQLFSGGSHPQFLKAAFRVIGVASSTFGRVELFFGANQSFPFPIGFD